MAGGGAGGRRRGAGRLGRDAVRPPSAGQLPAGRGGGGHGPARSVTDTYRMPPTDDPTADLAAAPRPLPVQRELFDIPGDVAYFNCASLAPQLKAAVEAGEAA